MPKKRGKEYTELICTIFDVYEKFSFLVDTNRLYGTA